MSAVELRKLSENDLGVKLIELREEQLKLKMKAMGENAQTHRFGEIKRDIARIKTLLTQMKGSE
jgi:large subunit ribosomal protein L29